MATTFSPLRIAITVLVAATALVHLYQGITTAMIAAVSGGGAALWVLAALFVLNFAGYVVLGAALELPALRRFQRVARWLLIGYAAVTIIAYFAITQSTAVNAVGLSDKAVEIVLIALLLVDGRRTQEQ